MFTRPGMTSLNMEVGSGPRFKIMKALYLLSLLFVCTGLLVSLNVGNASAADCDCTVCHGVAANYHSDGMSNPGNAWSLCSTCHASPPATGSHAVHSAPLSNATYGDTVTNTAGQYQFGCGHCHSMAVTVHNNGTPDVSLYGSSIGQSGVQACNDCHGSNPPSDHVGACPTIITDCALCHSGHTTGHMSTTSATITPSKQFGAVACAYCHTQYAGGVHSGTVRDLSNSCGTCHTTAGLSFASHSATPMTATNGQCTTCHGGMIATHAAHTVQHILTTEGTCTSCHSATPRVRPTAATMTACTTCHGDKPNNHADVSGRPTTCTDCHIGGDPGNCTACHGDYASGAGFHNWNSTEPPFATFTASAGSGVDAWTVTLNTAGSFGAISSVNWGDGTINTSTTHTYTSPGTKSITLNIQTASAINSIDLSQYPISGTVKNLGNGVSNATITLTGTTSGTTATDANGAYSFTVNPGTYAVHAAKAGYTMSADVTGIVAAHGKTNANFTVLGQGGQTQTAVLTVSKTNSNYGSVSSSPTGISCDAACGGPSTATFDVGAVVRVTASADTGKIVSSLTCTGGTTATCGGTSCYSDVTIASGGNSCAAAFADTSVKRVSGAADSYHLNLAAGLNAAVNGDILYLKGITFDESVSYDKTGVTVTLKGGYDSSFNTKSGSTMIRGPLAIIRGTLIIDEIIIY